jgi:hypothetical protein
LAEALEANVGLTTLFPYRESWAKENLNDYLHNHLFYTSRWLKLSKSMLGLTSLFPDRESWAKENLNDYLHNHLFFYFKKTTFKSKAFEPFFCNKKTD